jgi:uncharacterized protein (DUF2252 family)
VARTSRLESIRPFALAARQREIDRAATARFPHLFEHKRRRLLQSPHAFLRGSAPLFYEILAVQPDLAAGPPGLGWIVGDMHLENVGAYRTDKGRAVFDLNDFDDASIGAQSLDVLRLCTSVLLASRIFKATGAESIEMVHRLIAAYLRGARGENAPPRPPRITEMMSKAESRSHRELLDGRAPLGPSGRRRFVRGERYFDAPEDIQGLVPGMIKQYVAALGDRAPAHASEWTVEDVALRIAGTGSLGVIRVAALVRDRSGTERIVELKEARGSSVDELASPAEVKWTSSAERVILASRALVAEPPRQIAPVVVSEMPFAARKLFPQEDKLKLDSLHAGPKLDAVVQTIGHLVGVAHARGALERPRPPWSEGEVAALVDHAVELAGILEGAYLAYSRLDHDG